MKNSILGKARWLREVALATSKNNGARVAREWLKYAAMFVMLFTIGSGNVWGADETLTITGASSGHNAPWTTSYGSKTGSSKTSASNNIGLSWTNVARMNTGIQIKASENNNFYSTSYPSTNNIIKSIKITMKTNTANLYGSTDGQNWTSITYTSGSAKDVSASKYKYFKVTATSKYCVLSSISVVYTEGTTPSLTPTPTSLDWGNVLQSSSQSTKTFDISGSNLTGNLSVVVTGGYSVSCGSSISVTSGTPNVTTITVTPPSTSTPGEKNGKVTISGGGLASNVEVNLTMTVQASHTVTWMVNGSEHATTQVADGSKPEIPNNPNSCDGTSTTFVGWTLTPWSGKLDDVSDKTIYTSGSAMPKVSGPVTYHAVFAKETSTLTPVPNTWTRITSTSQLTDGATVMLVQYYSDFAINNTPGATSCTANDEITNNNTDLRWIAVKSGSKWKFKTSAGKYLSTNATTNNTTLSLNQTYNEWTISADAGGYSNCFNLNNGNDLEYFNSTFKLYKWSSKYSSAYPFYIYIQKTTGSTTYSQYLTTCCTSLGTVNGSINLSQLATPDPTKLKASWAMNAETGIASYTLEVYDRSDNLVKTINNYTSGSEITGLTPCTEYYVKLYTVSSGGEYCAGGLIGTSSSVTTNGYTLTVNKSNVTLSSGSEPTNICSNVSATYAASDGYTLPTSISVTNAGAENTGWTWNSSTGALTINKANVTGNVTVKITGAAQSNFINGETVFIQADSKDYSAWKDDACVKAWFNNNWSGGSAETTYWLFDATDADAGKKLFATVVPASGDLNIVQLQRFASNCLNKWNDNGSVNKASSNGVNTFRSYGSADNNVAWNGSSTILYLYGSQNSWESSLGTFADQGAGVWTATISNYTPDATSKDYKIKTSYNNGWIGNTGSNNNATLSDMIVGSTYNVTATLNVTTHALTMSKTFVKGTVHFDLQGHGSAIADLTNVAAGSKISAPSPAPNETGWDFGGWYKEPTCTNEWNFASDVVNETMTLYAKWTEKPKYTITLNAGNGTVSEAGWEKDGDVWKQQQSNGDASIAFPSASSNCAGWEFVGWATSAANNVSSDPTSKAAGATLVPASNVTYYAVYRQNSTGGTTYNKITDIGDLTTGDYLFVSTANYAMKNEVSSGRMTEASGYSATNSSFITSSADRIWTIVKFGSQVAIRNGSNFLGIDGDNNISLSTTPQFFTYTYNTTNERWEFTSVTNPSYQLIYGGSPSYFRMGTAQGSYVIYLYKQGAGLTGNYYTNPTCSDLSITGVADPAAGGSVTLSATSAKSGEKVYAYYTEDPAYRFKSWSVSGTGASISSTTAKFTEITVGSADVTLTANFAARVMYSVTWKANGEELTGVDLGSAPTSVETGEKITNLPPNPSSCDGTSTTFMGWVAESDIWSGKTDDVSAKHIYTAASEIPAVTGAVTYHAVWAQVDSENASWKKVTSVDDLQDGETVAFISAGDGYYLPNKASASGNAPSLGTVTKTSGDIHFVNEMKFTAIYNSTYDGFTFESVSATGKYLWVYNDNKGIYISAIDENKSNSSNIWYLEDFDDANSTSTGYGIGMYATTGTGNYRYLTTYGTSDWRSYKSTGVGTGTPANLLANIYRYANAYKQYLVKCCNTPTLTFAASPYAVLREDLGGASTTTWAEVDVTFTSNSTGTISAAQYSNATVTNGTAYQLAASKWQVYETTGGTLCGATHAYFEVLTQPSGETPGTGKFHVKTSSGQTGQGTYRIAITQEGTDESHGNYCETTVYGFVDVTLRDKFVDNVNGNGTVTRDGHGAQLATPTLSEFGTQEEDACHSERRKLKGWIKETDLKAQYETGSSTRVQTVDGLCETCADGTDQTSLIVAPGTNVTMSGATWYAVWAYER